MTFGILKSKIEKTLLDSYVKGTLKSEIKNFKKNVLENKNISKLYYLYDDLSTNKGLDNVMVNDYINECVIIYENTLNKIKDSDINKIKNWVKDSEVDNQYKTIDNLFSSSVLMIESKIESRRLISETLKKSPTPPIETPLIPINSMVNIANKTISNYINNLDESNKKELLSLLSESDSKLSGEYDSIKENVLQKLTSIKESTIDTETTNKVNETINKISSEKYDKLNYIRLKNLNSSI
jgi:hypothetical protein